MKRTIIAAALAALVATPTIIQSAQAGQATELSARRTHHKRALDANGNAAGPCTVRSRKTGASAAVGCAHAATFQAYVDDLEGNHGATIKFMGGIRRGKCWSGGLHPCGKALDVCQTGRGRVDSRCHLPGRQELIRIAARHQLTEGGMWCHSDMGHVQIGMTAGPCGSRTLAAKRRHDIATSSTWSVDASVHY